MERRPLGDSGFFVTPIALGAWAIGGTVETWGHVDDRESIAAIHQAIDSGINLIDTAPIYGLGHSEEIIGRAIQGRRDSVVLATKCGLMPPRSKTDLPPRCLARTSILRECDESLRRLRTNVIDLYQCHWPDPNTPIRETMEALTSLREQGKIRVIGLSNFSCEEIAAAREFGPIHCLQAPFSMIRRRAAADLLPSCVEHRMSVLAYSPLAKGLLTGKFRIDSRLEGIRSRDADFMGQRFARSLRLVEELKPVAERHGKSVTQVVINWTANHFGITSVIVGAKRPSQVVENVGGIGWSLTNEDRSTIEQLIEAAEREP